MDSSAVDKMIETRDTCLSSTGSTLDEIRICHDGVLPSDDKFKCFVACNLHEHNLIDKDGKFRQELMRVQYIKNIVGHCGTIETNEYCDNAYQLAKCLVEKLKLYDELCSIVNL